MLLFRIAVTLAFGVFVFGVVITMFAQRGRRNPLPGGGIHTPEQVQKALRTGDDAWLQ